MNSIDVIIPVYDGYADTVKCIESARATLPGGARIVLVNDASPSEDLAAYMRRVAGEDARITLFENEENLGFVGSVNRGMQASDASDVILLNADVVVASDWVARMRRRAYEQDRIGTVTAFSNDATICSFPNTCEYNALPEGVSVEQLDACFSSLGGEPAVEIPTGVGSCMYIRRACLDAVGLFDEQTFGRGYGEENDFCMRAAAAGWKNVLAPDVFVYHRGGVSFGDEKAALVGRAVEKLNARYPDYDLQVHRHIGEDPARPLRLQMLVAMTAASTRPCALYITHELSGGVTRHVFELARYLGEQLNVLVLKPVRQKEVEIGFVDAGRLLKDTVVFDATSGFDSLVQFLSACGVSHLHFHHIMGLPERVWGLIEALDCPYDVTLHDYYFINASPTQTSEDGRYQEDEERVATMLPAGVTTGDWRASQGPFLAGARHIISPSQATREIYLRYFPDLTIEVCPHPDQVMAPAYSAPAVREPGNPLRVGVIGAISIEKGADVLERVALHAQSNGLPVAFYLIGYAYRPLRGLAGETGPYAEEELARYIHDLEIDVAWYTATWPETYSYTLSAGLELGLPLLAPAIGAFSERLEGRPLTRITGSIDPHEIISHLLSLAGEMRQEHGVTWSSHENNDFYRSVYLEGLSCREPSGSVSAAFFARETRPNRQSAGDRVRGMILRWLLVARALPVLSIVARIVPVRIQRKIKRLFSRRPIHEL